MAGVKDIRAAVETASLYGARPAWSTLYRDEVHRFNKSQQDTFLPYLEDGTLTFVGATTENPSFEVVSAILSRSRVYVLRSLTVEDITGLLRSALTDEERGLGVERITAEPEAPISSLARRTETAGAGSTCWNSVRPGRGCGHIRGPSLARVLSLEIAKEVATGSRRRFDKGGDQFYDQISALHKAVRGTDPDAALYWLCRMLDGGCDPLYIARRVVRMAIEDIGLADPRAFPLTLNAWEAYDRLGSPEGELAIANAVVYSACAPKSNAVYVAVAEAKADERAIRDVGCATAFPECPDGPDEGSGVRKGVATRKTRRMPMSPQRICRMRCRIGDTTAPSPADSN